MKYFFWECIFEFSN